MRASLWLFLLSSCASAPPSGQGELGLAGLRRALGLSPVIGHVERSSGQAWLVHDRSGVRIAQLPTAGLRCAKHDGGRAVAFEGDPGAVLTFSFDEVVLWQTDPAQSCTVATAIFVAPDPDWELIAELEPADANRNTAALGDLHLTSQAVIDVPGPNPVAVSLTPEGATLRSGSNVHQLDLPPGDTCGMTANAMRAARPDGATWVSLSYSINHKGDLEACQDGIGDAQYESAGRLVVEVARDGAVRVVESAVEQPPLSEETSDLIRRIELPGTRGAFFEYEGHTRESYGREGPSAISQWSWTLVVGDRRFVLAEVE